MKSFTVIMAVCVALAAASVYKRDTQAASTDLDWNKMKEHLDAMLQGVKSHAETVSATVKSVGEETIKKMSETTASMTESLGTHGEAAKKELETVLASLNAGRAKIAEAVEKNTPDAYKTVMNVLEQVKNATRGVSESIQPEMVKLQNDLTQHLKNLETQIHDKVATHNH